MTFSPEPRKLARLALTSPRADIVNLIWSNGRIIDATSAKAPTACNHGRPEPVAEPDQPRISDAAGTT
jgi:hypothetical protein